MRMIRKVYLFRVQLEGGAKDLMPIEAVPCPVNKTAFCTIIERQTVKYDNCDFFWQIFREVHRSYARLVTSSASSVTGECPGLTPFHPEYLQTVSIVIRRVYRMRRQLMRRAGQDDWDCSMCRARPESLNVLYIVDPLKICRSSDLRG